MNCSFAVHRSIGSFNLAALALMVSFLSGCGHHHHRRPQPQTAPPLTDRPSNSSYDGGTSSSSSRIPPTPLPPGGISAEDIRFVNTHQPLLTEVGLATWYTAPYKGRRAANGEVFDDSSLTAAHRTLPMGSLIVVTNLKTGQWSAMRVSDRGPFVDGRIVDLTVASARATGIYRAGIVRVRVDVYRTPKPIDTGGRWCVQIGAFHNERQALKLKSQLKDRYPDASVIEFPGQESSYWVRIRPLGDNREQAETIANKLRPAEGEAYLTRLD